MNYKHKIGDVVMIAHGAAEKMYKNPIGSASNWKKTVADYEGETGRIIDIKEHDLPHCDIKNEPVYKLDVLQEYAFPESCIDNFQREQMLELESVL